MQENFALILYSQWSIQLFPESKAPRDGFLEILMDRWLLNLLDSSGLHWHRSTGCAYLRERKTHKHKQIPGIVPGLGGWHNFV